MEKTILLGGDIYLTHSNYRLSAELIDLFKQADAAVLNLEAPILDESQNYEKYPKAGPNLYNPNNIIKILQNLNIRYLGGANNHLIDYGALGIKSTQKILSQAKLKYSGFGLTANVACSRNWRRYQAAASFSTP